MPAKVVIAPVEGPRTVAVLGFKNLSGLPESAWLSTALSEMLSTELQIGKRLRIVPHAHARRAGERPISQAE